MHHYKYGPECAETMMARCAGLLLHNLSVFRGCEIVFDSTDVPDRVTADDSAQDADAKVSSLESAGQQISVHARMWTHMGMYTAIARHHSCLTCPVVVRFSYIGISAPVHLVDSLQHASIAFAGAHTMAYHQ